MRAVRAHGRRLPDSYWLAEPLAWQVANAKQVAAAEARIGEPHPSVVVEDDAESGATRVSKPSGPSIKSGNVDPNAKPQVIGAPGGGAPSKPKGID